MDRRLLLLPLLAVACDSSTPIGQEGATFDAASAERPDLRPGADAPSLPDGSAADGAVDVAEPRGADATLAIVTDAGVPRQDGALTPAADVAPSSDVAPAGPGQRSCPTGLRFTFEEGGTQGALVLTPGARAEAADAWCGRGALVWRHERAAALDALSVRLPFARLDDVRGKTFVMHVKLSSEAVPLSLHVNIGTTRLIFDRRPGPGWAELTAPIPTDLPPTDANNVYVRLFVNGNWDGTVTLDDLGWR